MWGVPDSEGREGGGENGFQRDVASCGQLRFTSYLPHKLSTKRTRCRWSLDLKLACSPLERKLVILLFLSPCLAKERPVS